MTVFNLSRILTSNILLMIKSLNTIPEKCLPCESLFDDQDSQKNH